MISVRGVGKTVGAKTVLRDVSLDVQPGEGLCVVGSAESGKTLLLMLLLFEEQPTQGSIEVDGIPLPLLPPKFLQAYRRSLGVFAECAVLLPTLTIAENIRLPMEMRGVDGCTADAEVQRILDLTHLRPQKQHLPASLTEAQRALARLGRAVTGNPAVILADDPLAGLADVECNTAITLLKTAHDRGASLIVFSRSSETARVLGLTALHLENGTLRAAPPIPATSSSMATAPVPAPAHSARPLLQPWARRVRITAINPLPRPGDTLRA